MSRTLLHYGADVDKTYDTRLPHHYGPLHCAIRSMTIHKSQTEVNKDLLEVLLKAGASIYRDTIKSLLFDERFELLEILLELSPTRLKKWTSKTVTSDICALYGSMET